MKRRDEVVQAALEVFRDKGYERATVREIAARAGLVTSGLYAHVGSKEELLLTAVRPAIEAGVRRMEQIAASELAPEERLQQAIASATEMFDRHPEVFVYLNELFPALERQEPALRDRYTELWTGFVDDLRPGGDRRDSALIALGILGMCNWMHRWYRPGGRRSATEIGRLFADTVLAGLASGVPTRSRTTASRRPPRAGRR